MTKVMLIAGVAVLAISSPAAAGPHGHGNHGGGNGGGHASAPHAERGGGFRMQAAPRQQRAPQRMNFAQHGRDRGGGAQMQRQRSAERHSARRQRNDQRQALKQRNQQRQAAVHQQGQRRQAMQQAKQQRREMQQRQAMQGRHEQQQRQAVQQRQHNQQQARAFAQQQRQQQARFDKAQARNRMLAARADDRRELAQNRMAQMQRQRAADYSRLPQRQFAPNFRPRYENFGRRDMIAPAQAMRLVGEPVSRASSFARLAALPQPVRYLYPDTPDRYYRYGDGYIYQVDRGSDLIDAILPLVAGGYVAGMTFPSAYMNSYVPAAYGFDTFYPDTPYTNYRYLDGNVYSVDPYSGAIEDVIPTYAYGYGVGQMLPAGYGYYNVPVQYRGIYYDTPDYEYRYAPGAIYEVDPGSQMITGVASLLAPGLAVGQPLPAGYGTYNVPMAYRSTYYDTPNAWYRYNNGYIYQVDPTTQLVTAVVRALLA